MRSSGTGSAETRGAAFAAAGVTPLNVTPLGDSTAERVAAVVELADGL
jgi:hypothetical protein